MAFIPRLSLQQIWPWPRLIIRAAMPVVRIPCDEISDWDTFHALFARVLGFPDFYGHNMNAWVDCLTHIEDPGDGMSNVVLRDGDVLTPQLDDVVAFRSRCPEQFDALVDSSALVNWRRIERGGRPVIALSFFH